MNSKALNFLVGMVIWYDSLCAVNVVSKTLQAKNMQIDIDIDQLKPFIAFLKIIEKMDLPQC